MDRGGAEVLSSVPAGRRQERVALGVALVSLVLFAALAPFAKVQLERVPAFIPLYQSALVIIDTITAALILAQWRVSRTRPLLILACGFIFTALMTLAHTLTFPGLFAPQGLLGAGEQSTAWLYMLWHAAFPVFVMFYALSPEVRIERGHAVTGMVTTVALALAYIALATAGESLLPAIMRGDQYRPAYHAVVAVVWSCSAAALYCLWRKQPRRVLDVWAMVVMCVWVCEVALAAVLNAGRFDLGFYAGRIYGLAAASFLLGVLLFEASELYARVARASAERIGRTEAEAANRAKDQFLAVLGHELRNPLAPIFTSLQIMRMRDANALAHERVIIERQIAQLKRLVDDLLDISGMTRGMVQVRRSRCEMADIVARAAEMAGPAIEARRHRLQVFVPTAGLTAEADGDRLAQALCNLLLNAAKYTPPEGRIEISGERDGAQIVLRVRDNGAGITPELMERLFQPFSQSPNSERAKGGLGLGLAIARHIAALHGGNIEAHSAGAGKGTEMVLRLPAASMEGRAGLPREGAANERGRAGPPMPAMRVLVVDDNPDAAATLALALRMHGLTVHTAVDARRALQAADEQAPDAALIDLALPDVDGSELGARLRKLPGLAALSMAAISGYALESDRARTAAAGFAAHFVKPVEIDTVLGFLRSAEKTGSPPTRG